MAGFCRDLIFVDKLFRMAWAIGHFPTSEVFRFPSKASPPEMPNPQALHTPAARGDGDRDVQQPKASMDESGECLPPIQRESTKYLQR